jgi:hypothetical protein
VSFEPNLPKEVLMRRTTIVAAAAALALCAVPSATGVGSTSFNDTIGDGNGAADVKSVVVSNDDTGRVTVRVNVDSLPKPSNTVVFVLLDTDRDAATGSVDAAGAEYMFVDDESDDTYDFARWNGSDWGDTSSSTARVFADAGGVTFSINRSELGNTSALNFWVRTRLGDPGATSQDTASDGADVWTYTLQLGAPAAPKVARVVIPALSLLPKAGKAFTFRISNVVLSTREVVAAERMTCKALLAGKALAATRPGGCTWKLPKTARGKTLVVTFTVTSRGASYTQRLPLKVS